eukprot:360339-Chlamydomonas_euryale.AAC.17
MVVSVNGEIYNYKALMKDIQEQRPGRKFRTQSDCEVSVGRPCAAFVLIVRTHSVFVLHRRFRTHELHATFLSVVPKSTIERA